MSFKLCLKFQKIFGRSSVVERAYLGLEAALSGILRLPIRTFPSPDELQPGLHRMQVLYVDASTTLGPALLILTIPAIVLPLDVASLADILSACGKPGSCHDANQAGSS
jgi:hypothetical protein